MFLSRKKLLSVILVSVCLLPAKAAWCQERNSNLETAVKRAASVRAGFKLLNFPMGSPSTPQFEPINGLDGPDAVPFLINVLRNGPGRTESTLFQDQDSIYCHIARCYAALCLGAVGDNRALAPLIEALDEPVSQESTTAGKRDERQRYPLSDYAAIGLGYLGDTAAVKPIIRVLPTRGKRYDYFAIALMFLGDIRAVKPLIQHASNQGKMSYTVHCCLQDLFRTGFAIRYISGRHTYHIPDFPELGELDANQVYLTLWKHWEKKGADFAKRQFEEYYPRWKRVQKNRPDDSLSQRRLLGKMTHGGVFVLPYLMEHIEKGDDSLIPATHRFIIKEHKRRGYIPDREKPSISRSDCLKWWQNNRDRYMVELKQKTGADNNPQKKNNKVKPKAINEHDK